MDRDILQFLFVGPLYSIFKVLNEIRRVLSNMATQEQVNALSDRLGTVSDQFQKGLGEVKDEIQKLKDAVPAEVDLSGLEAKVDSLSSTAQQLDDVVPDTIPTDGGNTGTVVDNPNPGGTPATDSPGEPQPETPSEPTDSGDSESSGENV